MDVSEEQQKAQDLGTLVLILSDYNNQRYDCMLPNTEREFVESYFKDLRYLLRNRHDLECHYHRLESFKKGIIATAQHALETEHSNAMTIGTIGCTTLLGALFATGYAAYSLINSNVLNVSVAAGAAAFSTIGILAISKCINATKTHNKLTKYETLINAPAEAWKTALNDYENGISIILGEYYECRSLNRHSTRRAKPRIRKL